MIKEAIQDNDGWLVDFKMFSNISICFNIEIKKHGLKKLYGVLENIGMLLNQESEEQRGKLEQVREEFIETGDSELIGTIQVTFMHKDPDMRIEIPMIPG